MQFISVQQAMRQGSGDVALRGWVYRERKSNKMGFIVLRDGTNIIQCVVERDRVSAPEWEDVQKLGIESSIEIHGTIKEDTRAPTGYEVQVTTLRVIQHAEPFPIQKDQSPEFLLDNRHLWLRSRRMVAIMRIRATVMRAFREHYERKGHIEFTPPIFQPTQSEGGSTLFPVKFDEDTTLYLTQSAQLYSEAMIFALNNVYCIAPCFRAEKSKTSRHLCEFWMAEMESAWMDLDGLCKDVEELLTHIVSTILKEHRSDLELLERNIEKLEKVKAPFTRMTYKEALEFVNKNGMNIEFGKDLRTIEENIISKAHDTPVIITNYPKEIMAFYKPSDPKDPATALCLDVIAPEEYGEIIGGSQRDLDLESMKQALRHMGEDPSHYEWYFDSRRYGSVPHSGHGMGVERVVAWICGLDNIKDAIPFPRTIKRFTP